MNIVTITTVKKHLDLDDKYNERIEYKQISSHFTVITGVKKTKI